MDRAWQMVRHVRAVVLSTVVVVVSLIAHQSGGGSFPPVAGLVAGWALLIVLLSQLTRHQLRLPPVLGLLTGGQLLVHLALSEARAATTSTMTAATARLAATDSAYGHHQMTDMPTTATSIKAADAITSMPDGGWAMLVAHLLAAFTVGVWLVAGEHAAWQLVRVITAIVRRSVEGLAELFAGAFPWFCPTVDGARVTAHPVRFDAAQTRESALGWSSRRRGPPSQG